MKVIIKKFFIIVFILISYSVVNQSNVEASYRPDVGVIDGRSYNESQTITLFYTYVATLNGEPINSGHIVSEEGSYELIVQTGHGGIYTYQFKIDYTSPEMTDFVNGASYKSVTLPYWDDIYYDVIYQNTHLNTYRSMESTIDYAGEVEKYQFYYPYDFYQNTIRFTSDSTFPLKATLYDQNGNILKEAVGNPNFDLSVTDYTNQTSDDLDEGLYTLEVKGIDGAIGDYQIKSYYNYRYQNLDESMTLINEGVYTFHVLDAAGNYSDEEYSFIIDHNATSQLNLPKDTNYVNNDVVFFSPDDLTMKLNGNLITNAHTVTSEGDYAFEIIDSSNKTVYESFHIDKTKPVYSGVEQGVVYLNEVIVTFEEESIAYLNGGVITSGSVINLDGYYTLIIKDQAGNKEEINFTVDLQSPRYSGVIDGEFYNHDLVIEFEDIYYEQITFPGLESSKISEIDWDTQGNYFFLVDNNYLVKTDSNLNVLKIFNFIHEIKGLDIASDGTIYVYTYYRHIVIETTDYVEDGGYLIPPYSKDFYDGSSDKDTVIMNDYAYIVSNGILYQMAKDGTATPITLDGLDYAKQVEKDALGNIYVLDHDEVFIYDGELWSQVPINAQYRSNEFVVFENGTIVVKEEGNALYVKEADSESFQLGYQNASRYASYKHSLIFNNQKVLFSENDMYIVENGRLIRKSVPGYIIKVNLLNEELVVTTGYDGSYRWNGQDFEPIEILLIPNSNVRDYILFDDYSLVIKEVNNNFSLYKVFSNGTTTAELIKDQEEPVVFHNGQFIVEEGQYQLILTDAVGNQSIVNFTIDKQAPTYTGVIDQGVYTTPVTIDFETGLSATLNGRHFYAGSSISFDGDYYFELTDQAGNKTEAYFSLEQRDPIFIGVEEGKSYYENLLVEFEDLISYQIPYYGDESLRAIEIEVDAQGYYYLVTVDVIFKLDSNLNVVKTIKIDSIYDISILNDGTVYINSYYDLYILSSEMNHDLNRTVITSDELTSNLQYEFKYTGKSMVVINEILYLATKTTGNPIYQVTKEGFITPLTMPSDMNKPYEVMKDESDLLYVLDDHDVFTYDGSTWNRFVTPETFLYNLHVYNDGTILVNNYSATYVKLPLNNNFTKVFDGEYDQAIDFNGKKMVFNNNSIYEIKDDQTLIEVYNGTYWGSPYDIHLSIINQELIINTRSNTYKWDGLNLEVVESFPIPSTNIRDLVKVDDRYIYAQYGYSTGRYETIFFIQDYNKDRPTAVISKDHSPELPFTSGTVLTDSGDYIITLTDQAGNQKTINFTIGKPELSYTGFIDGNHYHTSITIGFEEGVIGILNGVEIESGRMINDAGYYQLVLTDPVGNSKTVSFIIDFTAPTYTGVVDGEVTNQPVALEVFDDNEVTIEVKKDGMNVVVDPSDLTFIEEGHYLVTLTDKAKNQTLLSITIDQTPPSFYGFEHNVFYNEDITIMFENEVTGTLNGTVITSGHTVVEEGIYELILTDKAGNQTFANFTIDYTAPTLLNLINGTYHNTDITLVIQDDDIDYAYYEQNGLSPIYFESGKIISLEGDYVITIADLAGNQSKYDLTIDKTTPVINGVEDGDYTDQDVTLTFDSDVTAILNDIEIESGSIVSNEGSYTLVLTDLAGNKTTIDFTIDKTTPVINGVEDGDYTNQDITLTFESDVTAILNDIEIENGSTISIEGIYTLVLTDLAGNESTIKFIIDKTAPVVSGVEDEEYTNQDITLTFEEDTIGLINNEEIESGSVISNEGSYTLVLTDLAGNKTTIDFTIDKTTPVISGVEDGDYTNQDITLSFESDVTAILNDIEIENGSTISIEGSYTLVLMDFAGNKTTIDFTIDKTAPVVSGVEDEGYTNQDITLTFEEDTIGLLNNEEIESGSAISEEGIYTLVLTDLAGNKSTILFTIDKTAPTFEGFDHNEVYYEPVYITFSDVETATLNDSLIESGQIVEEVGSYLLILTDKAGNETVANFWIESNNPTFIGFESGYYYNHNITIQFDHDIMATLNGTRISSGHVAHEEGEYELILIGAMNAETRATFVIDKSNPTFSGINDQVIYDSELRITWSDNQEVAEVILFKDGERNDLAVGIESYTISETGRYQLFVMDRAGNGISTDFVLDSFNFNGVIERGYYNQSVTIEFEERLIATVDGVEIEDGYIENREGEHRLELTSPLGTIQVIRFVVDKTNPVITGVENQRVYDQQVVIEYNEGTASLNGRRIPSSYLLNEPGQYELIVTDDAGNLTRLNFEIIKKPESNSKVILFVVIGSASFVGIGVGAMTFFRRKI